MKKINYLLLFFAFATAAFQYSCNSAAAISNLKGLVVKGEITGAENLSFHFDKTSFDNSNHMFPSVQIDDSGSFLLNIEDKLEPGIYRMRIGAKKSYIILEGGEKVVSIKGELSSFDKFGYELNGAPASVGFHNVMKGYAIGENNKDAMVNYIKSEQNSLAAAFTAINVLGNDPNKIDALRSVKDRINKDHKGSKYASDFSSAVQGIEARIAKSRASQLVKVGLPAPEINLEDPEGNKIALSDLKGKIVLLDFWASWCGPCRKANPHVVDTYHKYKNKGFTVYSVSLDGINPRMMNRFKTAEAKEQQLSAAKKRWMDAIKKDQLSWANHVSDLQHWKSIAAQTYGVGSIPQTFLIDRDGKIAALNPRFSLEEEIKKLL